VLPRLVWHYGEPFADSSALPSFYLAQLTREHVTVALNGDGGDESFAGYRRYLAQLLSDRAAAMPLPVRRGLSSLGGLLARGGRSRSRRAQVGRGLATVALEPWQRYDRWMSYFTRAQLDSLYTPEHAAGLTAPPPADGLVRDPWLRSRAATPVEVMLDVDIQTYLPGDLLVKMDIATMAHSLEVRSPFLDHVLMERAARLPGSLKLVGGTPKALLKRAVRPWLPDEVVDRPKMGFGVPMSSWLRGPMRALPSDVLLDPVAVGRGIFREREVARLIDDHREARADHAGRLWALLQLELWLRTYIDGASDAIERPPTLESAAR
jgi:asparagine synthase (glutamine-hydrolysing)